MNRLSMVIVIPVILISCKNRESNAAMNTLEKLQKEAARNTTSEKQLQQYDSLKALYGDSLTYVSDIFINEMDTAK